MIKSLFIGGVTGLVLAILISFGYYYLYDQIFSHWFAATAILMVVISVFWMYADFKSTMAHADKVAKMDNDEIISQLLSRAALIVSILLIGAVLYGAYLWSIK